MPTQQPKHILIAPMDWGLGHTTRCVPIIRHIQSLGHIPVVAGNAVQRSFIEETFGAIDIIDLEGYNITYSKWNKYGQAGLLSQLPRISKTMKAEHNWLLQNAGKLQLHGIISDNRYGLYHPHIPSVIMTHQLQVQTGLGNVADHMVQKMHYRYLQQFPSTWVVDAQHGQGLAGLLSHPQHMPRHTKYLGLLSQFAGAVNDSNAGAVLLILLSCPEPQRTALSAILWQQAVQHHRQVIFVEGSESAATPAHVPQHITYHKRLTGAALLSVLQNAGMVICRSGYSTLMDLVALNKKAILIPTPGQTEQLYLGTLLHERGAFYCAQQDGFDLGSALHNASVFPYAATGLQAMYTGYQQVLEEWIQTLG